MNFNIKNSYTYKKIISIYDEYITRKIYKTTYGVCLKHLKNIHSGKRCFIVCNGPSLTVDDLDLLKNEISFASNFIINFYDETSWRPTYYVNSDLGVFKKLVSDERLCEIKSKNCFFQYNSRFLINDNTYPDNSLLFYIKESKRYSKLPKFSRNISKEIFDASTVTYIMLQIAVYMGFKEIIIIGADNTYKKTIGLNGNITENLLAKNHFYDTISKNFDDGGSIANIQRMELGYKSAEIHSKKLNFKIYNATRGGQLEIFQRKKIESFFE